MHTHVNTLQTACQRLESLAVELTQKPPQRIGYRERMQIERPLFLFLKEICHRHLEYELHGMTESHRKALSLWLSEKRCSKELQNFVRDAFELRVFVLALSNTNPYVQGDALSRASLTKRESVTILIRKLRALASKGLQEKNQTGEAVNSKNGFLGRP